LKVFRLSKTTRQCGDGFVALSSLKKPGQPCSIKNLSSYQDDYDAVRLIAQSKRFRKRGP
ncbi:MAG: hypothetical protein OXC40_08140, partial [Proteobacteria bacterium]|nr:hypothetical protein [Pseudomonadota bacterium]